MRLATTARTASLALFLSATSAATAPAQQQAPSRFAGVAKGDVVRLSVYRPSGGWTTGTVVWTGADSLGFGRRQERDTIALGRDNIAVLEVKRGETPAGAGTVVAGMIGGGLLGLLAGISIGSRAEDLSGFLTTATGGFVVGMVAGGILSGRARRDIWVAVNP